MYGFSRSARDLWKEVTGNESTCSYWFVDFHGAHPFCSDTLPGVYGMYAIVTGVAFADEITVKHSWNSSKVPNWGIYAWTFTAFTYSVAMRCRECTVCMLLLLGWHMPRNNRQTQLKQQQGSDKLAAQRGRALHSKRRWVKGHKWRGWCFLIVDALRMCTWSYGDSPAQRAIFTKGVREVSEALKME